MKKIVPIILLAILFGGAAWYSFVKEPDPVHEVPPPTLSPDEAPEQVQVEVEAPAEDFFVYDEPEPEPAPEPLPELNSSDDEITAALGGIIGADTLSLYLVKDQAISRVVVTIDSLTSRQVPPLINPVKPAEGKLGVEYAGEHMLLGSDNFARYDGYVAMLQALGTDALLGFYNHDRLLQVIDNLLETPDVPGPIYLTKPEAVYLFEDPALEAMTAGQKILVRMGSANAEVVKNKLTEIKLSLE
jgi:hypothetical protein